MNLDDQLLKFEVPEIIYGLGALTKIGHCAKRLGGEKLLLVTDPGIIASGWIDETIKYLRQEGLNFFIYDNVVTNPRDFQAELGAKLYLQKGCDVIVAVGGGSPIDTAKGIAILVSNYGSLSEYEGCNKITQPIPPIVCVPTTAGTGADVTQFAVITNTRKRMKMTILSRAITPDISVVDPQLLKTKPADLIAATGMDALTHAFEAYVSSLSWSMTDPHAIHAVELVARHLTSAVKSKNIADLEGMSVACLEAGIAFSNAILGAVHALAHPLGGFYDIHHGVANAVLLPAVVKRNIDHSVEKYARLARAMGCDTTGMSQDQAARSVLIMIDLMIEELGLPKKLSELGVSREDIPTMAELARADICMLTNPCTYEISEIIDIYQEIW